jgi:hypothetical protein
LTLEVVTPPFKLYSEFFFLLSYKKEYVDFCKGVAANLWFFSVEFNLDFLGLIEGE